MELNQHLWGPIFMDYGTIFFKFSLGYVGIVLSKKNGNSSFQIVLIIPRYVLMEHCNYPIYPFVSW